MGIVDRYIIKKYLGTFGFILLLLSTVVLVIDVQAKKPRIEENGFQLSEFLTQYYPFWIIYLVMTFMSILVFIAVIFFTSRMANNTEIVAIISSGASFHRFARPYFITSLFIGLFSLVINHYVLPWANIQKNELEAYTMNARKREQIIGSAPVSAQINVNEYIFIHSYNKKEKRGSGFAYRKYDKDKRLVYQLLAAEMYWDGAKQHFVLSSFHEKSVNKDDSEKLTSGAEIFRKFGFPPEELFPDQLLGQTKTTPELLRFIDREREKGNSNLNTYLNELYQRTAMPVSVIVLTFLALALASEKKRGGLGVNLAIGIALAFIFVFSFEALKVVSENKTLPPVVAMWLPNMVFAPLAAILYFRRANQ